MALVARLCLAYIIKNQTHFYHWMFWFSPSCKGRQFNSPIGDPLFKKITCCTYLNGLSYPENFKKAKFTGVKFDYSQMIDFVSKFAFEQLAIQNFFSGYYRPILPDPRWQGIEGRGGKGRREEARERRSGGKGMGSIRQPPLLHRITPLP